MSIRNSSRSDSVAKPKRCMPSSRSTRWVCSRASRPASGSAAASPRTPPAGSPRRRPRSPPRRAAAAAARRARRRSRRLLRASSIRGAFCARRRTPSRDPSALRSGAPLAWQMATARASAAWSGSGGSGSESSVPTIRCTWSFSAPPLPHTACLTACGVYEKQGMPGQPGGQQHHARGPGRPRRRCERCARSRAPPRRAPRGRARGSGRTRARGCRPGGARAGRQPASRSPRRRARPGCARARAPRRSPYARCRDRCRGRPPW